MNVLVYSGPEVLQTSLSRTLSSLRSVLYPNYTVQAISLQSLSTHPWHTSCALLVVPACRQHLAFSSSVASSIRAFVDNGGAFLGLRAGGRVGGSVLGGGQIPEYTLRFQDPVGNSVYCSFAFGDDTSAQPVSVIIPQQDTAFSLLQSKAVDFSGADKAKNTQVIARATEDDKPLAIFVNLGVGKLVLWGLHIEAAVTKESSESSHHIGFDQEQRRQQILRDTLGLLGLKLPSHNETGPSHPLPQFLVSAPSKPFVVPHILEALSVKVPGRYEDEHDTFSFHPSSEASSLLDEQRSAASQDNLRYVTVFPDGTLPTQNLTPLFDIKQYFDELEKAQTTRHTEASQSWGMGEALLYGEVVTSTQTLFDKNPRLLSSLPSPIVSVGTHQLAGRGRGGNSWVSPTGCLQFSIRLRVSLSDVPASRLVFIQYLFALAVAETCRDEGVLGEYGHQIRLKWPNDVYAVTSGGEGKTTKVAGILVYTTFESTYVDIVIGCGLNVLNPPPISSLASLLPDATQKLSLERTLAILMAKFEGMWGTFTANKGSFEPFMDLYLDRWLHSDQEVTLSTTTPPRRVRIVGITSDHGLLRTVSESGGPDQGFIDLQPDGNTFDLMSGLIMTKIR